MATCEAQRKAELDQEAATATNGSTAKSDLIGICRVTFAECDVLPIPCRTLRVLPSSTKEGGQKAAP